MLLSVGFVYDRDEMDFRWLQDALTAAGFTVDERTASGWRARYPAATSQAHGISRDPAPRSTTHSRGSFRSLGTWGEATSTCASPDWVDT